MIYKYMPPLNFNFWNIFSINKIKKVINKLKLRKLLSLFIIKLENSCINKLKYALKKVRTQKKIIISHFSDSLWKNTSIEIIKILQKRKAISEDEFLFINI